jgi:hypothetical protein
MVAIDIELSRTVGTRTIVRILDPDWAMFSWTESVDDDGLASINCAPKWKLYAEPGDKAHDEALVLAGLK